MTTIERSTAVDPMVAPRLPTGIDTPAVVIDLDIVERNARRLGGALAARGIALRPHAKTHKSVALAQIQLAAGAHGLTVGTVGEAEVFAAAGLDDLFIAYPVWAEGPKAARLRALHEIAALRLAVGFDSIEGARRLAAAVAGSRRPLAVMLELDPGNRRTGAPAERAGEIAAAARDAGLDVQGVFTHGGHSYGHGAAGPAGADEVATLAKGAAAVAAEGIEPAVISAGSTPTQLTAATAPVNEIRAGTYLIGDRQQWAIGAVPGDGVAIAVAATVVSAAVGGQVVIDAGAKTLTKDVASYLTGHGLLPAYPEAVLERVSDYHGVVQIPPGTPSPSVGEVVVVIPNHVCPVIDLRDSFIATRDGEIVGVWPVDARGRSG
ncbi:MAG TPA: alanine racemase [Candidatus Limnocylindrales bacterium]|jgi:D-serine deaminase-like pyridoxal phosphate-dependent protein